MKITDVTLTLFAWESIPSTIYGHHTARPTGKSDLGLLAVMTDQGLTGHAFLGTSSNPASLDGPGLIRFLKPLLMGHDPLDRERLPYGDGVDPDGGTVPRGLVRRRAAHAVGERAEVLPRAASLPEVEGGGGHERNAQEEAIKKIHQRAKYTGRPKVAVSALRSLECAP